MNVEPEAKRGDWILCVAPILAFTLFLAYLIQIKDLPFFKHLVANPLVYEEEARNLLEGLPRAHAFYMSPLYPAFVAMVYHIERGSRLAVMVVQGALLGMNVFMIGSIARKLLSRRMAVGASFVAALYFSFYHFAGELLPATLCLTFVLAGSLLFLDRSEQRLSRVAPVSIGGAWLLFLVYATPSLANLDRLAAGASLPMPRGSYAGTFAFFIIFTAGAASALILAWRVGRAKSLGNLLASGLVLGVSILVWSGTAIMTGLLAVSLIGRRPVRLTRPAVFVVGVMIPLLASLAHNFLVSGEVVPVTTSAGVNLFLGNNPASDGMNPFRFGEADAVKIEANRLGLSGAARSAFFRDRAYRFMREEPLDWLRLTVRKMVISVGRNEVDNNSDIAERRSAWRWLFMPVLHFGIVFPLAMAGIIYVRRKHRQAGVLLLAYAGFFAVGIVFFVAERFRLPAVAFLIPLAVLGARGMAGDAWRRRAASLALPVAILVAAAVVSNIDFFDLADREFPSITINKAHVERLSGNYEEARRYIEIAMGQEERNAGALFQLGSIEEAEGNLSASFGYYIDSLESDPFFYASYAGARRILEDLRINAAYLDRYMDALIRQQDHSGVKQQLKDFVGRRAP